MTREDDRQNSAMVCHLDPADHCLHHPLHPAPSPGAVHLGHQASQLPGWLQASGAGVSRHGDNQTNGHGLIVGVVEFEELQCCFNCISFTSNSNRKLNMSLLFSDTCTWTWGPTLESRSRSCSSPTSSLAPQSLMSLTSTLATSQKGRN